MERWNVERCDTGEFTTSHLTLVKVSPQIGTVLTVTPRVTGGRGGEDPRTKFSARSVSST